MHKLGRLLGEQGPRQCEEGGLIYAGKRRGWGHNVKRRQRGEGTEYEVLGAGLEAKRSSVGFSK